LREVIEKTWVSEAKKENEQIEKIDEKKESE
jgi:hypothetical protein